MAVLEQVYICPLCYSTKTIRQATHQTPTQFFDLLPHKVLCGVRGCPGEALPEIGLVVYAIAGLHKVIEKYEKDLNSIDTYNLVVAKESLMKMRADGFK